YKGLKTKQKRPPLTAIIDRCSGGGSDDGARTVKISRGTTQVRGLESEAIIGERGLAIEGSRS
ncbi:hypothetical protein Tco_1381819, partial [Tanacetum coccineum]